MSQLLEIPGEDFHQNYSPLSDYQCINLLSVGFYDATEHVLVVRRC